MQNITHFSNLLNEARLEIYPLLGSGFATTDLCSIDLSIHNPSLKKFEVQMFAGLKRYIDYCLTQSKAKVGIGGYLEQRLLYQQSPHFKSTAENRCIHLGIDLWAAVETSIFAPIDGQVHSFKYNDKALDYGATIILAHEIQGQSFFSLYGHLSLNSLNGLSKGKKIKKGTSFAKIGPPTENGGWVPHLHFQLILDMMDMEGDFAGVVSKVDLAQYQKICPNPQSLIVFETTS